MSPARRRYLLSCALPPLVAVLLGGLLLRPVFRKPAMIPPVTSGPPVAMGELPPRLVVSHGNAALLDGHGQLWIWGYDPGPGLSPTPNSWEMPRHATQGTNWTRLASGGNHFTMIRTDGTLWGAGFNFAGQLGPTAPPTPGLVQISAETNWVETSASTMMTYGLRRDRTLWAVGGTMVVGATPTVVGAAGLTLSSNGLAPVLPSLRWTSIDSLTMALVGIQTNGTLWAVEHSSTGCTAHAVETNHAWLAISAHATAGGALGAIRSDGSLHMIAPERVARGPVGALHRSLQPVPGSESRGPWRRVASCRGGLVAQNADGTWWGLGERLPVAGRNPQVSPRELRLLAWPTNTLALAGGYSAFAAFLADGTLWATGERLGVAWRSPTTPATVVAEVLTEVGHGLGVPGTRRRYDRGSPYPYLLWNWPGTAPTNASPAASAPPR